MFEVRPYHADDAAAWDAVVARSRNGNFLHQRGYMDYHADRFVDSSLVVTRGRSIVGVFPANIRDDVVTSHGGLTYGGLIATHELRAESTLAVFELMAARWRNAGVRRVLYKAIPHVFRAYPSEEDLYALQRLGATLVRRDISSVIPLQDGVGLSETRGRAVRRARHAGVDVVPGGDLAEYHALLGEVLKRHTAVPTHSLEELRLLQSRFPGQIVLHEARRQGALLAGVLVYDFGRTVHAHGLAVLFAEEHHRAGFLRIFHVHGIDRRLDLFDGHGNQRGRKTGCSQRLRGRGDLDRAQAGHALIDGRALRHISRVVGGASEGRRKQRERQSKSRSAQEEKTHDRNP